MAGRAVHSGAHPRAMFGPWATWGALTLTACGGGQTRPDRAPPDAPATTSRPAPASELEVHGTVGALDKRAVQSAVASLNAGVQGCVQEGQKRLPFMDGDVEIFVVVDANGRAQDAYLTKSTLGDHDVETCIVERFSAKQWPRPVGGKEGQIIQSYHFEAGHLDPPAAWSADQLADKMGADDPAAFDSLEGKLSECRQQAGTGPMRVTMYLDEDGLVRTAGAGMSDAGGEQALECVVLALQTTSFPAPGGHFVKVTLDI